MKNLDKILDRINGSADEDVSRMEKAAADEIAQIEAQTKNRVADIASRTDKICRREEERIMERARSGGDMRRREILLGAKVSMIDKAYATAQDFFLKLPAEQYKQFLSHLLADAVEERITSVLNLVALYGENEDYSTDFTAVFNERDKKAYAKDVIKNAGALLRAKSASKKTVKINLAEDTANIEGGLILRCGDIESNCSIEALMRQSRDDTGDAVAKTLFE